MTATSATATEHGDVLLMVGPDGPGARRVVADSPHVFRALTPDEATALANELTDAVDELELAEAVSGCNHQGDLRCTACDDRGTARAEAVSGE